MYLTWVIHKRWNVWMGPPVQVSVLFQSHNDLLDEFTYFLPESGPAAMQHRERKNAAAAKRGGPLRGRFVNKTALQESCIKSRFPLIHSCRSLNASCSWTAQLVLLKTWQQSQDIQINVFIDIFKQLKQSFNPQGDKEAIATENVTFFRLMSSGLKRHTWLAQGSPC